MAGKRLIKKGGNIAIQAVVLTQRAVVAMIRGKREMIGRGTREIDRSREVMEEGKNKV